MADVSALRDWAALVLAELPDDSASHVRATAAVFLIGWAFDARDTLLEVRRYVGDFPQVADQIDTLLTQWGREVN